MMEERTSRLYSYFIRSIVPVLPIIPMIFLPKVDNLLYYISITFLLFLFFAVSFILIRFDNLLLFGIFIFLYFFVLGLIFLSFWITKMHLTFIVILMISLLVLSILASFFVCIYVYPALGRMRTSNQTEVYSRFEQDQQEEKSSLDSEISYLKSNFSIISDDISGSVEPRLKSLLDSLDQAKKDIENAYHKYINLSMHISELYDILNFMKNKLSYSLNPIKRTISILAKYSDSFSNFNLSVDKIKYFSFSPSYIEMYKSNIEELRERTKRLESVLEYISSFAKDSNSETKDLNLYFLIFSIKPSILEFLRIHYSSYVVSLKTVQIASTSGSSFVRKSLLAIIQDIDSLSFKLNVQLTNVLQAFSEFEPYLSLFELRLGENLKRSTWLKSSIRRLRDIYYGSISKRLPVFEDKFLNISEMFISGGSFQDIEQIKSEAEGFVDRFEKLKIFVSSMLSDFVEMEKEFENIPKEIDIVISGLQKYKVIVDDTISKIDKLRKDIPRVPQEILTSKRVLSDINKFLSETMI
ncbi:MAG: hypothetical protein N2254_04070 [bacterium]|nr:hypothetical protein [bacterium]